MSFVKDNAIAADYPGDEDWNLILSEFRKGFSQKWKLIRWGIWLPAWLHLSQRFWCLTRRPSPLTVSRKNRFRFSGCSEMHTYCDCAQSFDNQTVRPHYRAWQEQDYGGWRQLRRTACTKRLFCTACGKAADWDIDAGEYLQTEIPCVIKKFCYMPNKTRKYPYIPIERHKKRNTVEFKKEFIEN